MTRRQYTKREKATAVGLAASTSTEGAANQLGIPESTLRYWMDSPAFAAIRDKTAEDVAAQMWVGLQRGLERIAELIPQTEDIAKVAVAVGILYDKRALLTGGPTTRTESRVTSGLEDHEKVALRDAIDRILHPDGIGATASSDAGDDPG